MHRALKYSLVPILASGAILLMHISSRAQSQLSSPKGYVNDFAGVLDPKTRERLETTLDNLKRRSRIGFYIVTVDSTGDKEIFDFSQQLARDWKIATKNSQSKSLLLVVSVAAKASFTQFTRAVQSDLPEGVLGDMSQHMRDQLGADQFSQAIDQGVQLFVSSLSQKLGFSTENIDQPVGGSVAASETVKAVSDATPQMTPVTLSEPDKTRPRVVNETPKPVKKEPAPRPTREAAVAKTASPTTRKTISDAGRKQTPSKADDEAEAEEVELTLTLPLAKRAVKLKEFLAAHPNSKSKTRATELLISTHAALGDQQLKNGDAAGGITQLIAAIDEADVNITDQLFAGVISQIPMNLYLRGEQEAALKAAQSVETKFGADPKRLLAVANFYLGIERGDEAGRIAEQVVKLASDMAAAHYALGLSLHISLRLEEAATEYKKALDLDPTLKSARLSLADLNRAAGKVDDALVLYKDQLNVDPKDKAARTGMVISLLELGRKEEASSALEETIADSDAKNLALLTGAAYWYVAHDNYEKAFELARKAVTIEPRYTWAQIALARTLLGLKRPLDAERSLRYARQYGKFPTLNYELANVLAAMGLYEEAAEILRESFTLRDSQIETALAGRYPAKANGFIELLAAERKASIFQSTAADSESNAAMLKSLLSLSTALNPPADSKIDETVVVAAARDFGSGNDNMRTFRDVYAASRLLRNGVGFQASYDLAEDARKNSEAALDVPSATMAVQADEYRELRARAISGGNVPEVADAPRDALQNILRGRIDDLSGWALFNQDRYPEAIERLKHAAETLPEGTPAWRNANWHLGVAYELADNKPDALNAYIKSYKAGAPDVVHRRTIEQLYRKINGSLDGLDERIGATAPSNAASNEAPAAATNDAAANKPPSSAETKPQSTSVTPTESTPPATVPDKTPAPETARADAAKPEITKENLPSPTPTPDASATPTPAATQPTGAAPTDAPPPSDESLRAAASRIRTNIKITGRVADATNVGIANVVVVLISPSGSVLASTTDKDGIYSFTVVPSPKTYRIIPSKDGYTFAPVDKTFVGLIDDQKDIDFVGSSRAP
jgi:uncharacterized membrane protein YgcG/tetratricopeptide (TPR) repeat protein